METTVFLFCLPTSVSREFTGLKKKERNKNQENSIGVLSILDLWEKETENATFTSSIYTLDFVNSIYVVLHVYFKFRQRK